MSQKIERETNRTVTRVGGEAYSRFTENDGTFNDLKARTGSIGRAVAELKAGQPISLKPNFRIARSTYVQNEGACPHFCRISHFPVPFGKQSDPVG